MATYEITLEDGSVHQIETEDTPSAVPQTGWNSPIARMLAPLIGSAGMDIVAGAPAAEAGAALGTAVAPGVGTVLGGIAGGILPAFLGATAGARLRARAAAAQANAPAPPFSESLKEALPYGAFGAGAGAVRAGQAALGTGAVGEVLNQVPVLRSILARPATILGTATQGAAGGAAASVAGGGTPEQTKQTAITAALLGGLLRTPSNFLNAVMGRTSGQAEAGAVQAARQRIAELRGGAESRPLLTALQTKGQEIWNPVESAAASVKEPVTLKELYDAAVSEYGAGSPQVLQLLKAFGRNPSAVTQLEDSMARGMQTYTGSTTFGGKSIATDPTSISAIHDSILAKIFEGESYPASELLQKANDLSSKISQGALEGSDAWNQAEKFKGDAKNIIYKVLSSKVPQEVAKKMAQARYDYKNFATYRNQVFDAFSPGATPAAPMEPGVKFLKNVAMQTPTPGAADDQSVAQFIQGLMGRNPAKGLRQPFQQAAEAQSQQQGARRIAGYLARLGFYGTVGLPTYAAIRGLKAPVKRGGR